MKGKLSLNPYDAEDTDSEPVERVAKIREIQ